MTDSEPPMFPWYLSSRATNWIWLLLLLLVIVGTSIFFARLPVYATGVAVAVKGANAPPHNSNLVSVVIFLPPEYLPQLRVGQQALIHIESPRLRLRRPLLAIDEELLAPEVAHHRYASGIVGAQLTSTPAAVAFTNLEPLNLGLADTTLIGKSLQVEVEIGSRRLGTLLPILGPLFKE